MLKKITVFFIAITLILLPTFGVGAQNPPQPAPPLGLFDALSDLGVRVGKSFSISCTNPSDGTTCQSSDLSLDWEWSFEIYPDTAMGCPQAFTNIQPTPTRAYKYLFTYNGITYDYRQNPDRTGLFLCTETGAEAIVPGSTTPGSTAACPITPRLVVNQQARVTDENGVPNNVRDVPGLSGNKVGEIPAGAVFTVLEGPTCTADFTWWRVNYNGLVGWTVEGGTDGDYFLQPVTAANQPMQPITSANAAQIREIAAQNMTGVPMDLDYAPILDFMAFSANAVLVQKPFDNAAAPITLGIAGQSYEQVAWNPAGTLLAATYYNSVADRGQLVIWNVLPGAVAPTFTERQTIPLQGRIASELLFNPAGTRIAVSNSDGTVNVVQIFEITTGIQVASLSHPAFPAAISFNNNGSLLAVATDDSVLHLWDMTTLTEVATLAAHNPDGITGGQQAVKFNPSGTQIAMSGNYNLIQVWDVVTRSVARTITLTDNYAIYDLAFSADGGVLIAIAGSEMLSQGKVYLFDVNTGAVLYSQPLFALVMEFASNNVLHLMVNKVDGTASWIAWGIPV